MKKVLVCMLTVMLAVTMMPGGLMETAGMKVTAEASVTLQNPRIATDSSMTAGQKVTYDCVWFGSYPQTEIVDKATACGTQGKAWEESSDYEVNPSLYSTLENTSGWDNKGDVVVSGKKYRRIKQGDATFTQASSDNYYNWNSSATYHYFRYDRIKWRVLKVSGSQALLLSDKALDNQIFNSNTSSNWGVSTIRSWLNGYEASSNTDGNDYRSNNFINSAFSSEQNAILYAELDNKTTGPYSADYGGYNTSDRVFLLSSYDMFGTSQSSAYGFCKDDKHKYDEARRSKSSTYAKAMGAWSFYGDNYGGNCVWWLRSPGALSDSAANVDKNGYVYENGGNFGFLDHAIRPALYLNTTSINFYSYAGTVCSNGSINEVAYSYTVTFDANGGYGAPASQTKTEGTAITLSSSKPTRDGYTFVGWDTSNNSTTASFNAGGIYNIDANVTLYAVWEKVESGGNDETPAPITDNKKAQTITAANKTIAINSKAVTLGAKTSGNGKITYSSSAPSVAAISSSGAITPKNYGTTIITIKAAETSTYKAASKRVTVTVVPKKMKLSSVKSPSRKTLVIKWVKDTAATKYEIQLCMKKDFKEKTLSRRYGKKVVKQKIKNMMSKTWYVRIRAWKKVGGKTYYGLWSSVKRVKVK